MYEIRYADSPAHDRPRHDFRNSAGRVLPRGAGREDPVPPGPLCSRQTARQLLPLGLLGRQPATGSVARVLGFRSSVLEEIVERLTACGEEDGVGIGR